MVCERSDTTSALSRKVLLLLGTDRQINGLMQYLASSVVWKAGHNTGTNGRSSSTEFWPVMYGDGYVDCSPLKLCLNLQTVILNGFQELSVRKRLGFQPGAIHESVQALRTDLRRPQAMTTGPYS